MSNIIQIEKLAVIFSNVVGDLTNESPPPNNVIFDLYNLPEKGAKEAILNRLEYATVYEVSSCKDEQGVHDCIIGTLREHIQKNGTIDELWLAGEGNTEKLWGDREQSQETLSIPRILTDIMLLEQELGVDITKRIVFNGCRTFAKLSNDQIFNYRSYADYMDMEVVGTTSSLVCQKSSIGLSFNTARYVQFTPKGDVIRDELDDPYVLFTSFLEVTDQDRSWIDCHLNKSQIEGENCMEVKIEEAKDRINYQRKTPHTRPKY